MFFEFELRVCIMTPDVCSQVGVEIEDDTCTFGSLVAYSSVL